MIEPPPVVSEPQPPPLPKPPTVWGAVGTSVALLCVVLFLANIVSIPFLVVSFAGQFQQGKFFGPSATAKVGVETTREQADKLWKDVARRVPKDKVTVYRDEAAQTITFTFHAQSGHARPSDYEQELWEALRAQKLEPGESFVVVPSIKMPSLEEMLTDPMILIGGALSLQISIWLVWSYCRRKVFVGDRQLPPFHVGQKWKPALLGGLIGIAVCFAANAVDTFFRQFYSVTTPSIWESSGDYALWGKIGIVLVGVVGAPIFEEIFFRGVLIGLFQRVGRPWLGVVFSSVVFGIAHFQDLSTITTIALMGLVLGTVYIKTKSLYATIALHMMNNLISFGIFFLAPK